MDKIENNQDKDIRFRIYKFESRIYIVSLIETLELFQHKMILSLIKWSLVLAFCLIAAVFVAFSPSHVNSVTYRGNTIKIDRDDYGIATIHASSMEDYLYGLGTALAEDRLFQTSFRAYAVQGRLA